MTQHKAHRTITILDQSGERLADLELPESGTDDLTLVGVQAEIGKPKHDRGRRTWTTDLYLKLAYHKLPEGKLESRSLKLSIAIQQSQS